MIRGTTRSSNIKDDGHHHSFMSTSLSMHHTSTTTTTKTTTTTDIAKLLLDMNNVDKDIRYMAATDIVNKVLNTTTTTIKDDDGCIIMDNDRGHKLDDDDRFHTYTRSVSTIDDTMQRRICESLIKQIEDDPSIDVQSNAIKCISKIIITFKDMYILEVISALLDIILTREGRESYNERRRRICDVCTGCIKDIIYTLPSTKTTIYHIINPTSQQQTRNNILRRLIQVISSTKSIDAITTTTDDDNYHIMEYCIDIILEILKKIADIEMKLIDYNNIDNNNNIITTPISYIWDISDDNTQPHTTLTQAIINILYKEDNNSNGMKKMLLPNKHSIRIKCQSCIAYLCHTYIDNYDNNKYMDYIMNTIMSQLLLSKYKTTAILLDNIAIYVDIIAAIESLTQKSDSNRMMMMTPYLQYIYPILVNILDSFIVTAVTNNNNTTSSSTTVVRGNNNESIDIIQEGLDRSIMVSSSSSSSSSLNKEFGTVIQAGISAAILDSNDDGDDGGASIAIVYRIIESVLNILEILITRLMMIRINSDNNNSITIIFLTTTTRSLSSYLPHLSRLLVDLISYDPNNNYYNPDDETIQDAMLSKDDEDEDDYYYASDDEEEDDDDSWKIRIASLKVVRAMMKVIRLIAPIDTFIECASNISEALAKRCCNNVEREDSVRLEALAAYQELILSSSLVISDLAAHEEHIAGSYNNHHHHHTTTTTSSSSRISDGEISTMIIRSPQVINIESSSLSLSQLLPPPPKRTKYHQGRPLHPPHPPHDDEDEEQEQEDDDTSGVCGDEVVEYRNKSILTTIEGYITRSMSMIIDHLTKILFIKDDNILSTTTMMVTDCCKTKTSSSSSSRRRSRSDAAHKEAIIRLIYNIITNSMRKNDNDDYYYNGNMEYYRNMGNNRLVGTTATTTLSSSSSKVGRKHNEITDILWEDILMRVFTDNICTRSHVQQQLPMILLRTVILNIHRSIYQNQNHHHNHSGILSNAITTTMALDVLVQLLLLLLQQQRQREGEGGEDDMRRNRRRNDDKMMMNWIKDILPMNEVLPMLSSAIDSIIMVSTTTTTTNDLSLLITLSHILRFINVYSHIVLSSSSSSSSEATYYHDRWFHQSPSLLSNIITIMKGKYNIYPEVQEAAVEVFITTILQYFGSSKTNETILTTTTTTTDVDDDMNAKRLHLLSDGIQSLLDDILINKTRRMIRTSAIRSITTLCIQQLQRKRRRRTSTHEEDVISDKLFTPEILHRIVVSLCDNAIGGGGKGVDNTNNKPPQEATSTITSVAAAADGGGVDAAAAAIAALQVLTSPSLDYAMRIPLSTWSHIIIPTLAALLISHGNDDDDDDAMIQSVPVAVKAGALQILVNALLLISNNNYSNTTLLLPDTPKTIIDLIYDKVCPYIYNKLIIGSAAASSARALHLSQDDDDDDYRQSLLTFIGVLSYYSGIYNKDKLKEWIEALLKSDSIIIAEHHHHIVSSKATTSTDKSTEIDIRRLNNISIALAATIMMNIIPCPYVYSNIMDRVSTSINNHKKHQQQLSEEEEENEEVQIEYLDKLISIIITTKREHNEIIEKEMVMFLIALLTLKRCYHLYAISLYQYDNNKDNHHIQLSPLLLLLSSSTTTTTSQVGIISYISSKYYRHAITDVCISIIMKNNNTEPTNTMMATVDVVVVEVLEKVVNAAVAVLGQCCLIDIITTMSMMTSKQKEEEEEDSGYTLKRICTVIQKLMGDDDDDDQHQEEHNVDVTTTTNKNNITRTISHLLKCITSCLLEYTQLEYSGTISPHHNHNHPIAHPTLLKDLCAFYLTFIINISQDKIDDASSSKYRDEISNTMGLLLLISPTMTMSHLIRPLVHHHHDHDHQKDIGQGGGDSNGGGRRWSYVISSIRFYVITLLSSSIHHHTYGKHYDGIDREVKEMLLSSLDITEVVGGRGWYNILYDTLNIITTLINQYPTNAAARYSCFTEDDITKILSVLMNTCDIRQSLISEVDLGPFKHKQDDGLPLRRASYSCLTSLLTSSSSSSILHTSLHYLCCPRDNNNNNNKTTITTTTTRRTLSDILIKGFRDDEDIQGMCCDLLGRRLWCPTSITTRTTRDDRTILENEIITNIGSIIQVIYEAIVNLLRRLERAKQQQKQKEDSRESSSSSSSKKEKPCNKQQHIGVEYTRVINDLKAFMRTVYTLINIVSIKTRREVIIQGEHYHSHDHTMTMQYDDDDQQQLQEFHHTVERIYQHPICRNIIISISRAATTTTTTTST